MKKIASVLLTFLCLGCQPPTPARFHPGDKVRSRVGGPVMVVRVEDAFGSVAVYWFDNNNVVHWNYFPEETLEYVQ